MSNTLKTLNISKKYNYVGIFLTLDCNLSCSYCINKFNHIKTHDSLTASDWIRALNRIQTSPDLPLTLQGGEPSLHSGFYDIVAGIRTDIKIDLLTNAQFDVPEFLNKVHPEKFKRDSIYPSIRISYHPETSDLAPLLEKVKILQDHGYSVGIYSVDHPLHAREISEARSKCQSLGIIFKTKEFLGEYKGQLYGTYAFNYQGSKTTISSCKCATSDLLIAPNGDIYRCHYELYSRKNPLGNILSSSLKLETSHLSCHSFGKCNPCDLKVKTDRFQKFGHCSVDVIF